MDEDVLYVEINVLIKKLQTSASQIVLLSSELADAQRFMHAQRVGYNIILIYLLDCMWSQLSVIIYLSFGELSVDTLFLYQG